MDTYLFYIRYKVLTITTEYPAFQVSFPQQGPISSHIYRRKINPINLQVPIKQVFHAFLNNVKDHSLALETPKFSPNALDELERYKNNFEVEIIERLVNPEDNPHHWLQTDILRIQNFLYHYFKDLTLDDQTIPQIKVISLLFRKYFRFNYQLLWSQQDQPAFTAFPNHFTADECLLFIISEQNAHPYFHKPQLITKQTLDYIRFDPLLITENDLFADNRPYHSEQHSQVQQNLNSNTNNYILKITTILKMIMPIMKIHSNNKIKMKTILMIIRSLKTMQVSLLLKNLHFQHIMHHKPEHHHQHTLNPLEFQLEL